LDTHAVITLVLCIHIHVHVERKGNIAKLKWWSQSKSAWVHPKHTGSWSHAARVKMTNYNSVSYATTKVRRPGNKQS